jgi:hypothetical protein
MGGGWLHHVAFQGASSGLIYLGFIMVDESRGCGWGIHCICFGAVRLLENPPFSIDIRQPSSPFRHCVCVLCIVVFPFSRKFHLAAYTGSKYYSMGSGIDCRDLPSVLCLSGSCTREIIKTLEINEPALLK